ncbi:MAG: hypothetical protein ACLRZ9_00205 [Eubacterium sp.]
MEEYIQNEEWNRDTISRLEKTADKIEENKAIAYLEYDIERNKIEPENEKEVEEERNRIRPEIEQQAKKKPASLYGREFDSYLFEDAVEDTDKLLGEKTAVRAEEIEAKQNIDGIRER